MRRYSDQIPPASQFIMERPCLSLRRKLRDGKMMIVAGEHCGRHIRDDRQTHQEAGLGPRQVWIRDEGGFKYFPVMPSLPLFRIKDGCHRRRARKRRWSTRRRWRTRRRRESRRRTTRRRRRQRRWEGAGKREDFALFLLQVENLTTPLISYVGSGVPQEVLDMPVDPNEPTYCVCQQVSNYIWRILHLFWCFIYWSLFNSLLSFALSFIELFNCRFLTVRWLAATTRIVPSSGSTSAAWTWPTSRRASGIAPSVCPCSRRKAGSRPYASSNCDHAAKGRNLKVLAAIIYDVKSWGLLGKPAKTVWIMPCGQCGDLKYLMVQPMFSHEKGLFLGRK